MRTPLLTLAAVVASSSLIYAEDARPGTVYRIVIDSTHEIKTSAGLNTKDQAVSTYDYRLIRHGDVVSSAIDRMETVSKANGVEGMRMQIDGKAMRNKGTYGEQVVLRENRPAMFDPIGKPLLDVTVDDQGAEIKRELKDGGPLFKLDSLDNTRTFHTRFPSKETEWDSPATFRLSGGLPASGTLHYKKVGAKNGVTEVAVSGRLEVSGKIFAANIKRGDCSVKGIQSFDEKTREWVGGRLNVHVDIDAEQVNGTTMSVRGPSTFTLVSGSGAQKP